MHEFDEEPWDDGEATDDKELNQLIDGWLSSDRPERYDSGDKEWMDAVVEKTADSLSTRPDQDEVIHDAARRRVYQREGQATKRANKVLRNISETGALPIGWGEGGEWKNFLIDVISPPLSIGRQRIRLGAASPSELEMWVLENVREEDKRRAAQAGSREGARMVADWERQQGVQRFEDLRAPSGDRVEEPPDYSGPGGDEEE